MLDTVVIPDAGLPCLDWRGETAVVIGSGPSLTQEQVNYVRGKARVIVVNNGYQLAPWADVLYAESAEWWDEHPDANDFAGLKLCGNGNPMKAHPNVCCVKVGGCDAALWTKHADWLPSGGNSGFQAVALAIRSGATPVPLLGFDMRRIGGQSHWHPDHMAKNPNDSDLERWADDFKTMATIAWRHSVEVINCTPGSALMCFPMQPLQRAL